MFHEMNDLTTSEQGTTKTQRNEIVSYVTSKQILRTKLRKIWAAGKFSADFASTNHILTRQSTPVLSRNTPCTAEYPPTSHQERTPSKVCLHTCQPSVIRTESPSFWHRWSRRRKSPSFDGHLDINKLRLFLVIKSENSREYSHHFVILFLCWTHTDLLLQTTLDHPNFTFAHSRPSFKTVATRTGKLDVSQTDVSPKKIQIQK